MIKALLARFAPSTPWLIAIVVLFAVGMTFGVKKLIAENDKLIGTVATQQCVIADAAVSQDLTNKTDKVTEASVFETSRVITKLVVNQQAMDDEVDRRVKDIKKDYAVKPVSPENDTVRRDAISAVRINGLWNAYCAGRRNEDQTHCSH